VVFCFLAGGSLVLLLTSWLSSQSYSPLSLVWPNEGSPSGLAQTWS
jgi:hypothetical protein